MTTMGMTTAIAAFPPVESPALFELLLPVSPARPAEADELAAVPVAVPVCELASEVSVTTTNIVVAGWPELDGSTLMEVCTTTGAVVETEVDVGVDTLVVKLWVVEATMAEEVEIGVVDEVVSTDEVVIIVDEELVVSIGVIEDVERDEVLMEVSEVVEFDMVNRSNMSFPASV